MPFRKRFNSWIKIFGVWNIFDSSDLFAAVDEIGNDTEVFASRARKLFLQAFQNQNSVSFFISFLISYAIYDSIGQNFTSRNRASHLRTLALHPA